MTQGYWATQQAGLFLVDNFRITNSELLNSAPAPAESQSGNNLASSCWEWVKDHKEAIGVTVAVAAGSAIAAKFVLGRLGQGTEGALASGLNKIVSGTRTAADEVLARAQRPAGLPVGAGKVLSELPLHVDATEVMARIQASQARQRAAAAASGHSTAQALESLLSHSAPPAPTPGGALAHLEGAATHLEGAYSGFAVDAAENPQTSAEWILRATHDGGAHHAGPFIQNDPLLKDLLGLTPRNGTRRWVDETLIHMGAGAEDDLPTAAARHMPGLRFEMPALSVRPKD